MTLALEAVVKQLTDSGIIAAGKLENFVPPKAHPASVEELVRELVKQGQLTKFQAQAVAAGKAKSLMLGEYTLLDRIGAGGMGQVFKAVHRRMERQVAIKMLPPTMTKDVAALARFQREVVAAAKLSHANIVHANDAGQAGNVHFLVMEYVEGSDLSALVKKSGPLPVEKVVNYILQAARGLEFAHGEGVIHRDIKPANLLLDKKGTVKILDMGLARISSDGNSATQAELTGTGAVMGTVDYMAPEQAMSTKSADARADIYSLGCSLYYLLVGSPVYDGETLTAKLVAHQFNPIPPLPGVSPEVEAIFQKMVAKKLDDRYQTMTEVIADLQVSLSSPPSNSSLPSPLLRGEGLGVRGSESHGGLPSNTDSNSNLSFLKEAAQTVHRKGTNATKAVKPAKVAGGGFKNKRLALIGAGLSGALVVLLGIWVIVRDKQGNEVSRLQVPDGGTVTLQTAGDGLAPPLAKAPFDATQARAHQEAWAKHLGTQVETPNSVGMKMVLIPPGEFLMGSTDEQVAAALKVAEELKFDQLTKDIIQKNERPQHKVVITKPFLIGATEVTVGQFKKFSATGYQTKAEKADESKSSLNPVDTVNDELPAAYAWNDAVAYCKWLSEQDKTTYRLPTEAEWEYACRAGTTTQCSFGDDYNELSKYGWHGRNAGGKPHPVGTLLPNGFGLFDMQGNLNEWCGDYFDEKWHLPSTPNDPNGPAAGSTRVIRGGYWVNHASICRSAYRSSNSPSQRYNFIGFRVVRELSAPSTTASVTQRPTSSASSTKLFMHDPAFPQWMKDVQALPAEGQVKAVSKKLTELNPGYDGEFRNPLYKNRSLRSLHISSESVSDVSPLRVLTNLEALNLSGCKNLSDLSPLRGLLLTKLTMEITSVSDLSPISEMRLTSFDCKMSKVSDLKCLAGMPLNDLACNSTQVASLAPIEGMPLTILLCDVTLISDLSPVRGLPLKQLRCNDTSVSDLTPVAECKTLESVNVRKTKVTAAGVVALQNALPNCKIEWSDPAKVPAATTAPAQSTKLFLHDPAFPQWMKDVQAMPAAEQVNAVSKKLVELNPEFDGVFGYHKIENDVVTQLRLETHNVTDISPIRALTNLKLLACGGINIRQGKVSDLSPLSGLSLTTLICSMTPVDDLSPLQGMPLSSLSFSGTKVTDLSPLKGMPLTSLDFHNIRVSDLTSLKGMPLTELVCGSTSVSDLSPIIDCKTLSSLRISHTKVTAANVAAIHTALPNCKIEWPEIGKFYGQPAAPNAPSTKLFLHDPAFPQWVKDVQAMPAGEQITAVSKKLVELNPGFDGVLSPSALKPETDLTIMTDDVSDLSPVRALTKLSAFRCNGSNTTTNKLTDLSPLQGMQLSLLSVSSTKVSDLSPLRGMPLMHLFVVSTQVSDLSPLTGMPLTNLLLGNCSKLSNLQPLKDLPLHHLECYSTGVSDLTVLATCTSLKILLVTKTKVTAASVAALQKALPNCKIDWVDPAKTPPATTTPAQSTKLFMHDPAFPQWVKDVQALPAAEQVKAVSKKLVELNPGFDGKVTGDEYQGSPNIESGVVIGLWFHTENVTDISPVRALRGLQTLGCGGVTNQYKGELSDLSPLTGMNLTYLHVISTKVSDLSPLKGMPLTHLQCSETKAVNLSPLKGMALTKLYCFNMDVSDLSPLAGMPLTTLGISATKVTDLSPLKGMPLTYLSIHDTPINDLSPLRGMPLKSLKCYKIKGADLSPLEGMNLTEIYLTPESVAKRLDVIRQMKSLTTIGAETAKYSATAFWKRFDAGEFGKPLTDFNSPEFQKWMKDVQAMPAEEQINAVSKKLVELNPGFDGVVTGYNVNNPPKIENGVVTEFGLSSEMITDIAPVRALTGLKALTCQGTSEKRPLVDLAPLTGLKLTSLNIGKTSVSDLMPLKGMPLTWLSCYGTQVSDLTPLRGMPLTFLGVNLTRVVNLSPLVDCPTLLSLHVRSTDANTAKVTLDSVAALQKALPNCKIDWDDPAKPRTPVDGLAEKTGDSALDGEWTFVEGVSSGSKMNFEPSARRIEFRGTRYTLFSSNIAIEGTVQFDAKQSPMHFSIIPEKGGQPSIAGKLQSGICELFDNGTMLRFCLGNPEGARPTKFDGMPQGWSVQTYKKKTGAANLPKATSPQPAASVK